MDSAFGAFVHESVQQAKVTLRGGREDSVKLSANGVTKL
jgi:hypothetical protein